MAPAAPSHALFLQAQKLVASCNSPRNCYLIARRAPFRSKIWSVCEKIFIEEAPFIRWCSRFAICTAASLVLVMPIDASDIQHPSDPPVVEKTTDSAASASQSTPSDAERTKKSGKYDVDRIGQRGIGNGVNLYSLQKERALGEAMAANIDRHTKFVADPDLNNYINLLGQKIARNSDAEMPVTIKVIDSLDLTAFSLPGGFLYVDKGLIMEVENEAELAGLMAHEIAHIAARHATRSATRMRAWKLASIPLSHLGGPAGFGIEQIVPLTFKKFSRDAEIEADLLGIEYLYAAGYDPQAFLEALEKLHSKETQAHARLVKALPAINFAAKMPLHHQIEHMLSNYPPMEERIEKAQTEISTLLSGRDGYVVDTSEFQVVKARLAWANRPILRRHHSADGTINGPVLRRHPSEDPQPRLLGLISGSQLNH